MSFTKHDTWTFGLAHYWQQRTNMEKSQRMSDNILNVSMASQSQLITHFSNQSLDFNTSKIPRFFLKKYYCLGHQSCSRQEHCANYWMQHTNNTIIKLFLGYSRQTDLDSVLQWELSSVSMIFALKTNACSIFPSSAQISAIFCTWRLTLQCQKSKTERRGGACMVCTVFYTYTYAVSIIQHVTQVTLLQLLGNQFYQNANLWWKFQNRKETFGILVSFPQQDQFILSCYMLFPSVHFDCSFLFTMTIMHLLSHLEMRYHLQRDVGRGKHKPT